jgi:subfamily B ATP-binding cassette protein MsbA
LSTKTTTLASDWKIYKRLLTYVKPYIGIFALSLFGFMLFAAMDVLAADMMQYLIDSIGGKVSDDKKTGIISTILKQFFVVDIHNTEQARIIIPAIIILLASIRGVGYYIGNYYIRYVGNMVVFDLRQQLFLQMVKLPIAYIASKSSGSLISRLIYNVSQVSGSVTTALTTYFREGLTAIFLFIYLVYINWQLTLTFILIAPIVAGIVNLVGKRFRRISHQMQHSMGDITHVISETVNGNREVKIYGAEGAEVDRFFRVSKANLKQQMKMAMTNSAFSPVIQMMLTMALAVLVWFGLDASVISSMSSGLFVSYLIAAGAIGKPIRQLTTVIGTIQQGLAASEDIFSQFDEPLEQESGSVELKDVKGTVRFDDVHFTYQNQEEETIKGISFEVKAGEMIALVGASGGGKTTLVGLIPKFFIIDKGDIFIDDVSIKEATLKSLRQQVALVSQNVVLMNDTIQNNIAFGELNSKSLDQVKAAAKVANADDFIEAMDLGYQTMVGDNGLRLSGGQRQRIAIARAVLKDAPILILDEATSALDNESEKLIQAALYDAARNRTTIVIAHRLSTIERADKILVIDGGLIVEQGTHDELLSKNGRYADLHRGAVEKGEME